jgi:hypothetical protein
MLPIEHIKEKYNKKISSYGIIQYSNYPLLSHGNKNFSENFFSINFYNEKIEPQKIEKLRVNIELYIKKLHQNFNTCLFIDPRNYKWNDYGCNSTDLGDILHCSCNHLTDFSFSNYNPVNIVDGMINILFDAWIINSFSPFSNLNFSNAIVLYIYISILIIYLISLNFTLKYDELHQDEYYDKYIYKTEFITDCCSEEKFHKTIEEVKIDIFRSEYERLKKYLKKFEERAEKNKLNTLILKHLNLDVKLPEIDLDIDINKQGKNKNII